MAEKIPSRHNWYFGNDLNLKQNKTDILWSNVEKLLNILLELFKYDGLPETLPYYELEKYLLLDGSCTIKDVKGNLYALKSNLGGKLNAYYHPKTSILVNPWLDFQDTCEVDKDCVVIYNTRLRTSVREIIIKYARLLTECEVSLNTASRQARVNNFLIANDDRSRENAEKVLERIDDGEDVAVIGGSMIFDAIKSIPFDIRYDFETLTRIRQYIEKSFLKEFGISTNNESKSQYVSDENLSWEFKPSRSLIVNMFNQRKDDIEKLNAFYGTNVTISYGEILSATEEHYNDVMSQYDQEPVTEETSTESTEDEGGEANANDGDK